MAATLEEIIVGSSIRDIECFEQAIEENITYLMFEDPMLSEIFKDIEKAYREGTYNKDSVMFDISIYINNLPKLIRAMAIANDAYFYSLKWEYNKEYILTQQGKRTYVEFIDYAKAFANNYSKRCEAEENRKSL